MPNPIKAFFDKKKAELNFKRAGPGQKLGDAQAAAQTAEQRRLQVQAAVAARGGQGSSGGQKNVSAAQSKAAEAAMARFNTESPDTSSSFQLKRSQAAIRAQAMKEIEKQRTADAEINRLKETYGEKEVKEVDGNAALVCSGVYFHCPLIGPEVLPKAEMKEKIRDFLYSQLEEEKGLTACLIIHSMTSDKEKVRVCVETLVKYLDNITNNPDEEKFRKIRKSNKAFTERVASVKGHDLFLEAVGFESMNLDGEEFFVFSTTIDEVSVERISSLKDALINSEPIQAELDRGMKVLRPQEASAKYSLPQDFFSRSADEIRKEQQMMSEAVEREGMLRTKAMREREAQRERRKYCYTLIRVRFPDGLVLQGTFSVYERYRSIHDYVMESLNLPLPFVLYFTGGASGGSTRLETSDYDTSLLDLGMVPSAVLTFAWHPEVAEEVKSQLGPNPVYLKEEVLELTSDQ